MRLSFEPQGSSSTIVFVYTYSISKEFLDPKPYTFTRVNRIELLINIKVTERNAAHAARSTG